MLLLAVSLAAPAVIASNHTTAPYTSGDDDREEYREDDETASFDVTEAEARGNAEEALSNGTWTLEESERDEEGYYEFEFLGANGEDEAEVTVDGVTGETRSVNVEREREGAEEAETERAEAEEDVGDNETAEQRAATLEEARERIEELRERVQELQAQVRELRANNTARQELPGQASDRAREARDRQGPPEGVPGQARGQNGEREVEIEVERENGSREVEVEAERRGPSQQARENVNGTPGNSENRPNVVTRMLQSMFG